MGFGCYVDRFRLIVSSEYLDLFILAKEYVIGLLNDDKDKKITNIFSVTIHDRMAPSGSNDSLIGFICTTLQFSNFHIKSLVLPLVHLDIPQKVRHSLLPY